LTARCWESWNNAQAIRDKQGPHPRAVDEGQDLVHVTQARVVADGPKLIGQLADDGQHRIAVKDRAGLGQRAQRRPGNAEDMLDLRAH